MKLFASKSPLSVNPVTNFPPHLQRRVSITTPRCKIFSAFPNHPSSTTSSSTTASSSSSLSSFFGTSIQIKQKLYTSLPPKPNRYSFYTIFGFFEHFTERAINSVVFSQREAKALGKDAVFTQHILLGLIAEDHSPGGFLGSGVTIDEARDVVRRIWGHDENNEDQNIQVTSAMGVPFSRSAKRVFEAAVEYSRTMGYNFIAPEHIALGLFIVDDGRAGRVLRRLGANVNQLAAEAISRLEGELAKDGRGTPTAFKRTRGEKIDEKLTRIRSPEKVRAKSALEKFCVDLTARASDGLTDPVIGRETEIERMIQILCRRTKCNPILLGEAGVGKTAIAEGLAINIIEANVPVFLLRKRIMSLDIGLLISGAKERGELEARITSLIKEIKKSGDIILFIDEAHTIIGAGAAGQRNKGSGLDIANILKPSLGRGEFQCIASTTFDEYRIFFEKDKAFARRFQPVFVNEPTQEDAIKILLGLRERYESHHKCKYTMEAIKAAVFLSARYISDRNLPDKAIDLIDEAGSRACIEAFKKRKEQQTSILLKPPSHYWQEIKAVQAMHEMGGKLSENDVTPETPITMVVGPEEIAEVASLWSGIPVQQLSNDETMRLIGLDEQLKRRVIGQDEAVLAICRAVKRSRVGLKDPNRPIAAMLFCGPTGVGKTELAKALAMSYFGSESAMIRLDMSEYMERHTVSKLIGSPPGYVGYGEGGILTEAIRRHPFTVVLLDEIEKAHPRIFHLLLQLFEDGHLTDSQGRRVSFKNALIVMTSNVGSIRRQNSIGFLSSDDQSASYSSMRSFIMEELKAYFRPELLNRIDEIVVFRPLEKPQMLEIASIMLHEVKERVNALGIGLEVSEGIIKMICKQGFDRSYGARPLRRAVTQMIEDPLSESLLSGNYQPGDIALIHLDELGNPVVKLINRSDQNIYLSDNTNTIF